MVLTSALTVVLMPSSMVIMPKAVEAAVPHRLALIRLEVVLVVLRQILMRRDLVALVVDRLGVLLEKMLSMVEEVGVQQLMEELWPLAHPCMVDRAVPVAVWSTRQM